MNEDFQALCNIHIHIYNNIIYIYIISYIYIYIIYIHIYPPLYYSLSCFVDADARNCVKKSAR